MFLLEIIRLGLHNLRLHKLRSFLTSLGIILGVAAVIVMVAIGEGTKQAALRDIEALGATNVILRSIRPPESSSLAGSQERGFVARFGLTRRDRRRLDHFLTDAAHIVSLKAAGNEISYRDKRLASQTFGTSPELQEIAHFRMARGRYLTSEDLESQSSVAVIGHEIAKQFFTLTDPLGAEFRIGERIFRVVGVLRPIGFSGGMGSIPVRRDLNLDVHIPLTTAEAQFGDNVFRRQSGSFSGENVEVSEVYVTASSVEEVLPLASRVTRILQVDHPEMTDIEIIVPWELLENVKRTQLVWNIVLTTIAAISLLIGGIGIMNIMLASVTERTREIGIRRALGATRQHITVQFLVETGSLAATGGLIGIALGVLGSIGIGRVIPWVLEQPAFSDLIEGDLPLETSVTGWSIIVSFLVAAMIGLVFGIYPAIVASQKDPIVALRHD
jgi:putative ABC transport system permease protein